MKTSFLSSLVFCNVLFVFLLFGSSLKVFAQCPTVNNANPDICLDGAGYSFRDLNSFVTDGGNGIVWYTAATGGTSYNPNELVTEGTYYVGDISGNCGTRSAVTVNFTVDGIDQVLDRIYCSKENATFQSYIDDVLKPFIPADVTVQIYGDLELTTPVNPSDVIPVEAKTYYIVLTDSGGCTGQIESGQIGVFSTPSDPSPELQQLFCSGSNPTVADLNTNTNLFYNWYESLDSNGDPIIPALLPTDALVDGNTYYMQIEGVFCSSNPVAVVVEINTEESGISSSLNYCENNLPVTSFNLFDELGDPKDATGTWAGPETTSNGYLGTVNISGLRAGSHVFSYTVLANGSCPDLISNVTIDIEQPLSSGTPTNSGPITFCEASLPTAFDLNAQLTGADTDGQWTAGNSSSGMMISSPIDLTSYTPGTYYFSYTQNISPSICLEETTTIQVDILTDPNAGNAVNQSFCENDLANNSPFDLFMALDGSQSNNNGVWRDANNNTISNSLDISSFTFLNSPYLFNYTIGDGDCIDTETITINVEEGPESGTANSPAVFCLGLAPTNYNLFDLLTGADLIGNWYVGTDNLGETTSNEIDLSLLANGTYNYTYEVAAIGACTDELVTVQIVINLPPNSGTPSGATYCENELGSNSPLDLFTRLTGADPGGVWSDDNATGALTGSQVDLTNLAVGFYNYTYTITALNGCVSSSTVVVSVENAPESGTAIQAVEFCEESAPTNFDLFSLLIGADQTGTWYSGTDNSGAVTNNPIDLIGFTEGVYNYTYEVAPIGTCTDELVTVQIIINPIPNTGIPSDVTFCENDLAANSPFDLFMQLDGADLGGVWSDDSTSGVLSGSQIDLTNLPVGFYNYTYAITDAQGCEGSATVVVTIAEALESGTANPPAEFCKVDLTPSQTFNLFDLLSGANLTGTWSDDNATGTLSGSSVMLDNLPIGTSNFTYSLDPIGSCIDEPVTVSININEILPPAAEAVQDFCDNAAIIDLVVTGVSVKWYDALTGGNLLDNTTILIDKQTYYASQTDAVTGCESALRTAVVANINQSPIPGNALPLAVCDSDNNVDLFNALDGTQDTGGTWQNDDGVGSLVGNSFDATGVVPGSYQFTYIVAGISPCIDAQVTITLNVEAPLNAGTSNTLIICSDNGTTDLFSLIEPADLGGTWSPALTSGTGLFDPLLDAEGTYTYTLTNSCGDFSSDVIVTVSQAPDAGTGNSVAICQGDDTLDLFDLLGSTAQTGGEWLPELASGTGVFDPAVDVQGIYKYTVKSSAPCVLEDSAEVTVTVNDSPSVVVIDPNPEFCLSNRPTVSELESSIESIGTVNWYEDALLTKLLLSTDYLIDNTDYFATQTNSTGCESSAAVQINVTLYDTSTPTIIDSNADYCINDEPTINDLSLNIVEYISEASNIIWYDSETGGTAYDNWSVLSEGTYYAALINTTTRCESSIRLSVTPDLTACGELEIPDGFSPNGDGINDTLDVDFLGVLYPNFNMEIYNRYGNMVYKGGANTPRFDGTSNQSSGVAKGDLPVGVYFYIFDYQDGENPPEQGRIYLSR